MASQIERRELEAARKMYDQVTNAFGQFRMSIYPDYHLDGSEPAHDAINYHASELMDTLHRMIEPDDDALHHAADDD